MVLCHVCHGSLLEVLGSCRRCLEADERRADNALEAGDLQGLQALLRLVPFYLLMRSALAKPFPLSTARCLRDISQLINSSRGLEPPLPPGPPRSLDICQMAAGKRCLALQVLYIPTCSTPS